MPTYLTSNAPNSVKGIVIHNQLVLEKTVNNTTCYSTCLQICSTRFNS